MCEIEPIAYPDPAVTLDGSSSPLNASAWGFFGSEGKSFCNRKTPLDLIVDKILLSHLNASSFWWSGLVGRLPRLTGPNYIMGVLP